MCSPHSKYNLHSFNLFKLQVIQMELGMWCVHLVRSTTCTASTRPNCKWFRWSWDQSGACVVDGFRYGVGCSGALDCKVLNASGPKWEECQWNELLKRARGCLSWMKLCCLHVVQNSLEWLEAASFCSSLGCQPLQWCLGLCFHQSVKLSLVAALSLCSNLCLIHWSLILNYTLLPSIDPLTRHILSIYRFRWLVIYPC